VSLEEKKEKRRISVMATQTIHAHCPECDAVVTLVDPEKGEIVECGDCGAELEVISLEPVQLQLAPEEEEDWGE
jgi:alpha-aminoadipate carrier protein LysW